MTVRQWWGQAVLQVRCAKHIGNVSQPRLSAMCRLDPKRDKNKLCNLVKHRRSLYPSGGISTVQRTVFESDSLSYMTLQNTYRHKRRRTQKHEPLRSELPHSSLWFSCGHILYRIRTSTLSSCSVSASVIQWGAYDTAAVQEDQGPCLQYLHKFLSWILFHSPQPLHAWWNGSGSQSLSCQLWHSDIISQTWCLPLLKPCGQIHLLDQHLLQCICRWMKLWETFW